MQASHPAQIVTHPAAAHHHGLHAPTIKRLGDTSDPETRGMLVGAGAALAIGAAAAGLYSLYQYYAPRSTQYTLKYFNGRGLAETSRLLFALANVKYTDARYPDAPVGAKPSDNPTFLNEKESLPFGQVPVLVVGGDNGVVLAQSRSIERYLAKQFGMFGANNIEAQLIESVSELLRDSFAAYTKARDGPNPAEEKARYFDALLPNALRYLNRFATAHSTSADHDTLVGSSLSLADVHLYQFLSIFDDQASVTKATSAYSNVRAVREAVANRPEIKKWIAERPNTTF